MASSYELFGKILESARANNYRHAAHDVGKLISHFTGNTIDQVLAWAQPREEADAECSVDPNRSPYPADPKPVTLGEFHGKLSEFMFELTGLHHANEEIVRTGLASDPMIKTENWYALERVLYDVVAAYIPVPPPAPAPEPAPIELTPLDTAPPG